jgi:pimeloyl-ACP methyl ester carboxylesterase
MSTTEIQRVRSADGTEIAYRRRGEGPSLIFVDGAFCTMTMGPGKTLVPALADRYTTFVYDRRGRGKSGDASTYEVGREVEDLAAIIAAAGGSAYVFGHSSGAVLALEAARAGVPVAALALYEPPFVLDDTRPPVPVDLAEHLARLADAGRGRAVVRTFMDQAIRTPKVISIAMSIMPGAGRLSKIAHTVAYDATIMSAYQRGTPLPDGAFSAQRIPTLLIAGAKSPQWIQTSCEMLAASVPQAELARLARQSHMVKAAATAPAIDRFFATITSPVPPAPVVHRPAS